MLTIPGHLVQACDRQSRRQFLQIGSLALTGLSLADILRAEAAAPAVKPPQSVIQIYLMGGPPHLDMIDPKPEAPAGIRGEFKAIQTRVSGVQFSELLPSLAARMDKLIVLRSIVGSQGGHTSYQCETGWPSARVGNHPCLGTTVSRLLGPVQPAVPAYVVVPPKEEHFSMATGQPGFLGPTYGPFKPHGPGLQNLALNGVSLERLADRKQLLGSFDRLRRDVDASGAMNALDSFNQRAFDVLTSRKLLDALDLDQEDKHTLARYDDGKPVPEMLGGPGLVSRQVLLARRLVEAGVRCVTLTYGQWDTHRDNFRHMKNYLPRLDRALAALLDDLDSRGLLDRVTVLVWGEFGRTPIINKDGGRDHWPAVNSAILAGGGLRSGQVIGATDRQGANVANRPVHVQEVFATLYRTLGIDAKTTTLTDLSGRPQYLVDHPEPICELV
jgi:hypothetical protein